MTVLERAARAMLEAKNPSESWSSPYIGGTDDLSDVVIDGHFDVLEMARAVLLAVRNLDAEGVGFTGLNALVKGKESLYSCSADPELDDARQCFTAMIDAILEGK